MTAVIGKYKTTATPALPTKTVFTPKLNYLSPTNNLRNANNSNLKPQPRMINSTLKCHYSAKTSTFPPTRSANTAAKITGAAKSQFTGKTSQEQRANTVRTGPIKAFGRKNTNIINQLTASQDTTGATALSNVTSTLSDLTENCNLNGKNRIPSEPNLKTMQPQPKTVLNLSTRRKKTERRKKLPKTGNLEQTSQELSSSDTNITNISADSLDAPFRFRRKRDNSKNPEPMDCISNSVITADVTPDNYEETANSQGNKLYKIKALRKKVPSLLKKDGVHTRSSSCTSETTVKKK